MFQLASLDRFLALPTPSGRPVFGLTPDHLAVLAAFVDSATPEEVEAYFPSEPGCTPTSTLIDDLLTRDLLVVVGAPRGHSAGFGHIESHLPMLADLERVRSYGRAIQAHAKGARVAEVGCGTGILSLIAAKAGARSIFAVEESDIAEVAEEVFRANGVHHRVQLERANSFDVEPPEPVDLLVHEIFGVDPLEEGVLASIADARRRWLAPGGRLLPHSFTVRGCAVGGARWSEGLRQVEHIQQLAKELGVDLDPILDAGREGPTRRLDPDTTRPAPEEVRTEAVDLIHIDLTRDTTTPPRSTHILPVRHPGTVGAILIWFDVHLDDEHTLSTSPFAPPTHWAWQVWDLPVPITVAPGGSIGLDLSLDTEDASAQVDVLDVYTY